MTVEKGKPWERPASGPAEWTVTGDDATLAAAVREHPGARVAFAPSAGSDLARAVAITDTEPGGTRELELPIDALRVVADGRELFAVNMVVVGVAPDHMHWWSRTFLSQVTVDGRLVHSGRAVSALVASGQFLRGANVVPRGHPGDGKAEVQLYTPARSERTAMRRRLPLGTHLPHPGVSQVVGRQVVIRADRGLLAVEVDGVGVTPTLEVRIDVVPEAFSLLI
jgi:YegS C-terminal NAD kinase beta sandwich-like domain